MIESSSQREIPAGMIDLGIGQPSPSLLPVAAMAAAASHCAGRPGGILLSYGAEQGDPGFRIALAGFLAGIYGAGVDPAQLLITNGASQAIDLICTLYSRPGDTILVEEPTYFLARKIFADHGLNPVALPMDAEGLVVAAVEDALARTRPAFLYTIPTYHNPTSACLSAARREALARLSRDRGLTVVADEVYHPLAYTETPPPPLAAWIPAAPGILSLGSFSKILAPGLRLGWLQAAPAVIERFVGCGVLDSGGGLNPFTSGIVRSALEIGRVGDTLAFLKETYAARLRALCAALRGHLPAGVRFDEPAGGFFVWLTLPEGVGTIELRASARLQNVDFMPGPRFSSCDGLKNCLRLSFAYYDVPELVQGAERLARSIRALPLSPR